MPKHVATPKQSGGGGFSFADKVSAFYLLRMLSGRLPLDADAGQIDAIRFEKRVDGWFLDDIVLLLRRLDDGTAAVAVSVKSSAQITAKGFPEDFARAVWEQRFHVQTNKFNEDTDYLALATASLHIDVKAAWDALLMKAIDADPGEFAERLSNVGYGSEVERAIFSSLNCPSEIHPSKTLKDTTTLLKRLRHFQFDFESNPSSNENDCVALCGELLRVGGPVRADSLWTHLKQIARRLATSGGDITRTQLADRLRARFSLVEFPNYISDWLRLSNDRLIRTERIKGRLAGQLEILRDEECVLNPQDRLTAFVGASGSGKTVIAKKLASEAASFGHVMWLNSADLNANNISELFSAIGIKYRLPELISESIAHRGLIVVDGIERLNKMGLENVGVLLRCARIQSETTGWRFVLTCVVDAWEITVQALQRELGESVKINVRTVSFSFSDHLESVVKSFPTMARVLQRPTLSRLFKNLKILDLVLSNANHTTNASSWVGESDILEWYWSQQIQVGSDRVARSRIAQKLGCIEADNFLTEIPIDEFSTEECKLASGLEEDRVIWIREERFGFEHDLLGDWARTRFLISQRDKIVETISNKAFNPRWHRAIRLYGLRLLENQPDGDQQWSDLLSELTPDGQHKVEGDLVLESSVFAANAETIIEKIWSRLAANSGVLLTRLLVRFVHVATLPNQRSAGLSSQRVPFWPLWPPLLRVLYEHRGESLPMATDQVTSIADIWLRNTPATWPLRNESAELLLQAARLEAENISRNTRRVDSDIRKRVFSRFLTAATVRPDDVAQLALALVERKEYSLLANAKENLDERHVDDNRREILTQLGFAGPRSDPWPEGPLRRVDSDVADGFLANDNPLQYLFVANADAAIEVLLALLIREPLPKNVRAFDSPIDEFLHVHVRPDWTPGMFFQGPFLNFLHIDSQKGIEVVVRLVNFVTDRWMDNRKPAPASVSVTIDADNVEYFGASAAYFWYRDFVRSPHVVVPALMALEKWFHLCIEREEPVSPAIRQILRPSRSTAMLGVLSAVGAKQPKLFNSDLNVLVPIWQLQVWEEQYRLQKPERFLGITMMQWTRWGETIFNLVRDWHCLEHRKTTIGNVLLQLFVSDSRFRSLMKRTRKTWKKELRSIGGSNEFDVLERILLQFDERNWKGRSVENGLMLEFVEPDARKRRLGSVREENERRMTVTTFPIGCRKLIDERTSLIDTDLDVFWQDLRRIADEAVNSRSRGDAPEHAILGGIAVLILLHESWINSVAERAEWCREQLLSVLNEPPPPSQFQIAESSTNYHWHNFAAILIPPMLAQDLADETVRSLFAEFVLTSNYSVTQDLMNAAFEHRTKLGDDFSRLQRLLLVSSGMRNVMEVTHGGNSFWDCPDVPFDFSDRVNELIAHFVQRETPPVSPRLVDIASDSNDTIVRMVRQQREITYKEPTNAAVQQSVEKRIRRGRGFEALHLRAGFSWLERILLNPHSGEVALWIDALENLLHGFLRPLGGIEDAIFDDTDQNSFFSVPGDWDTWIFDLISLFIPKLGESDGANRLWEPILSFGLDRAHWVDAFLSSWFRQGLSVHGGEENFFREWKAMIAYAWARDNWQQTRVRSRRSHDKLFVHLMGLNEFGFSYIKDAQYRPYIADMKDEYRLWIEQYFPNPDTLGAFANFLTFASAQDYLRDGVFKLAEEVPYFEEWHWNEHYHLDEALLKLLEHDWKKNSRIIGKDAETRKHFSTLLKSMTDRQIPRAMELQDKMIRAI